MKNTTVTLHLSEKKLYEAELLAAAMGLSPDRLFSLSVESTVLLDSEYLKESKANSEFNMSFVQYCIEFLSEDSIVEYVRNLNEIALLKKEYKENGFNFTEFYKSGIQFNIDSMAELIKGYRGLGGTQPLQEINHDAKEYVKNLLSLLYGENAKIPFLDEYENLGRSS